MMIIFKRKTNKKINEIHPHSNTHQTYITLQMNWARKTFSKKLSSINGYNRVDNSNIYLQQKNHQTRNKIIQMELEFLSLVPLIQE